MRALVRAALVSDMVWTQLESLSICCETLRLFSGIRAFDAAVRHVVNCAVSWRGRFSWGMWPSKSALLAVATSWRFAFWVSSGAEWKALREIPAARFASRHWENHRSRVSFSKEDDKTCVTLISLSRQKLREEEDKVFETRRQMIQRRRNPQTPAPNFIYRLIPQALLLNRKSILVTTAFSIVIGIFAYYYKTQNTPNVDVIRWGLLHQPAQLYYRFLMK